MFLEKLDVIAPVDEVLNQETNIYNAGITCYSIFAAMELGLLDEINKSQKFDVENYCHKNSLDLTIIELILTSISDYGYIIYDYDNKEVSKTDKFDYLYKNKGYFLWLFGGYGEMLVELPNISRNSINRDSYRNGYYIAKGGADYGKYFIDKYVLDILDTLDYSSIVDLGCGSGKRLIKMVIKKNGSIGLGIEVNDDAFKVALSNVNDCNLKHRIDIIHADATNLGEYMSYLSTAEVLTSFFMGHDFWPREKCCSIFKNFRDIFPNLKYFLFCDTYRSEKFTYPKIFTRGFEITHACMRQYIPTKSEWHDLFKDSGWRCIEEKNTDIPLSTIFILEPRDIK